MKHGLPDLSPVNCRNDGSTPFYRVDRSREAETKEATAIARLSNGSTVFLSFLFIFFFNETRRPVFDESFDRCGGGLCTQFDLRHSFRYFTRVGTKIKVQVRSHDNSIRVKCIFSLLTVSLLNMNRVVFNTFALQSIIVMTKIRSASTII